MSTKITRLVVHCSDSPHRGDTAADVHQWHIQRGWSGIGYHHTINELGLLENGRPHYWTGAHVEVHNTGSLGIMLFGKEYFTPVQYEVLENLLNYLLHLYPGAEICGHTDLNPHKSCPNLDVKKWWEGVKGNAPT